MRSVTSRRLIARMLTVLVALLVGACGSAGEGGSPPPTVGIEVGNLPPPLEGTLSSGEPFQLDANAGVAQVLVYYRSATCGLCRAQLEQMQASLPAYEREGARLYALTLDAPEISQSFAQEAAIGFPIISVDSALFATWGMVDSGLGGPPPATYILDRSGVIHFRHIGRNASDRTSDAEVVSILTGISDR